MLSALVASVVSGGAGAAQLDASVRSGFTYDSNVRNSSVDEESGTKAVGGLVLDLHSGQRDDLSWGIRYLPVFAKYFGNRSDLDNLRHQVQGNLQFVPSAATTLSSRAFYDLNDRNQRSGLTSPTDPTLPTVPDTNRIERFGVGGNVGHRFSSRVRGYFSVNQAAVRFELDSLSDADTVALGSGLDYSVSSRQSLGAGVSVTDQRSDSRTIAATVVATGDANGFPSLPALEGVSCDLRRVPRLPPGATVAVRVPCDVKGQETQFFQVFGRWGMALSPRFRLTMQAGPTHIQPSIGAPSTTLFANIAMTYRGKRSTWTAGFSRSESGAFGSTSSTVVSTFRAGWDWKPSERWGVNVLANYSLRESVQQRDDRTIDVYSLTVRANRQLTRRLSAGWIFGYRDQQTSGGLGTTDAGFDSFETSINLQYSFDPLVF